MLTSSIRAERFDWADHQRRIYSAVDGVVSHAFPGKNHSLCSVYAIVGANVASVVLNKPYMPICGLSAIDAGAGYLIKLTDNDAFKSGIGAYRCWIESADQEHSVREVVDLTSRHNRDYALKHGFHWKKLSSPDFIWGLHADVAYECEETSLPSSLPDGEIWIPKSAEGDRWLAGHIRDYTDSYVKLTALASKNLQ